MHSQNSPIATSDEYVDGGGEIIQATEVTAIEAMTRAETDVQIVTAKRFPRSIDRFMSMTKALATRNKEVAESCFYSKPQGKDKNNKQLYVEGPSIGLANILAYSFGNLLVIARIVREAERTVTAQALAWDLESNNRAGLEVVGTIWGYKGRYSDDMIKTACQRAISIARRNAIFAVVPKPFWQPVYLECRGVASGRGEPFEKRIAQAFSWLASIRVKDAEAFEILQVQGKTDLTEDHLELLTGFRSAIKEGEATIDQVFRPTVQSEQASKTATLTASLKAKAESVKPAAEVAPAAKQEPATASPAAKHEPKVATPAAEPKKDARSDMHKWIDQWVGVANEKIAAKDSHVKPIESDRVIDYTLDKLFASSDLVESKHLNAQGHRDARKCNASLETVWKVDPVKIQDLVAPYLDELVKTVKPKKGQASLLPDADDEFEGAESFPEKS